MIGLDLSLRQTGMCYIPEKWNFLHSSTVTKSIQTEREKGAKGNPHVLARLEVDRYLKVAKGIVDFVRVHGVQHVVIENYAYSRSGMSSSVVALAELGGVVKSQLVLACKAPAVSVAVNSARSFLTGGLKRGGQKAQVDVFLRSLDFRFDNYDEMDAFVVAFYWYSKINELDNPLLAQRRLDF